MVKKEFPFLSSDDENLENTMQGVINAKGIKGEKMHYCFCDGIITIL